MEEEFYFMITLKTGEILIVMTDDSEPMDKTNIELLNLNYPAIIVPGVQKGQIGFQKFFPFSEQEGCKLKKSQIATASKPLQDFIKAYEGWLTQVKAADSGIIVPGGLDIARGTDMPQG
jgi:hypothetical protein